MNANNNATLETRHQTLTKFYVLYENGFLVLPDAKTVVGVDEADKKKLIIEDITLGTATEIGVHSGWVRNVLFDAKTFSIFVGDTKGYLMQYQKKREGFILLKDYGKLGIGQIRASAQVGGFAIFGGEDHSFVAVDISQQRPCPGLIKSPFLFTHSLQVCHVKSSKVYLGFGGSSPKYSRNTSDFLEVSLLFAKYKNYRTPVPEEKGRTRTLLQEKEQTIDSLNLKVQQLQASLQEQRDKNQGTSNLQKSDSKTSS